MSDGTTSLSSTGSLFSPTITLVAFEDELRNHLRRLEHERVRPPSQFHHIDVDDLHRHFLDRLREYQHSHPSWVRKTHEAWAQRLEDFAAYLATTKLIASGDIGATVQDRAHLVLDAAIDCLDPETPLVARLVLAELSAGFARNPSTVEIYAMETRLTRQESGGSPKLTQLGRIFLRLHGQDAIQWLLIVEVLQSQGNHDDWRASRDLLERALAEGVHFHTEEGRRPPFSLSTLDRLADLGVIRGSHGDPLLDDLVHAVVPGSMRSLIRNVLESNPWSTAAAALLHDERARVVPAMGQAAVEATIEQTRMFAHEVRNALGPVRYNVDELLSEELQQNHRLRVEAAKKGVVRVLDFVDQLVTTSELITEPATTFDLESLFREALGWIDDTDSIELAFPAGPIHLRAPRPRLLRALLDVVRNALQSATPPPPVRISAERHDREVRIMIDDGGPGVPAELRTRIFDDGFTTRPGGSGFGLAFLRQVVERELRGRVSCEDADLGGARFTITIPDAENEP